MDDPTIFSIQIEHYPLHFKQPAGTSRGVMHEKNSWFVSLSKQGITGKGEISIIEGLNSEYNDFSNFNKEVQRFVTLVCEWLNSNSERLHSPSILEELLLIDNLSSFPSILFGMETALLDWRLGGKRIYFNNSFSRGERAIPINGLIWMGSPVFMQKQVEQKLSEGYDTIKLKIGALDWEQEYQLLKNIRKVYSSEQITLRVDANGGFQPGFVRNVLDQLAELHVHSIEQPIPKGMWKEMSMLCKNSPVPIALDEELIGVYSQNKKRELLDQLNPAFIVLKPSLHGGISGTREWITFCEERNISWWMTSALESNIGLNAIAQFCGEYENTLPQGLGTGALYTNNTTSNLVLDKGLIKVH